MFFDTINAYQRTAALKSAIELELFTAIARGTTRRRRSPAAGRVAERGARILADFLTVIGFLTKEGDGSASTPDTATFLDRQSPAYVGGAVEFLTVPHMRERFEELSDAVPRAARRPRTTAEACSRTRDLGAFRPRDGRAGGMPADVLRSVY